MSDFIGLDRLDTLKTAGTLWAEAICNTDCSLDIVIAPDNDDKTGPYHMQLSVFPKDGEPFSVRSSNVGRGESLRDKILSLSMHIHRISLSARERIRLKSHTREVQNSPS